MRPIYGVYYICCMGNYVEVVKEQLSLLESSGLFKKTKKLICFICNYKIEQFLNKEFNDMFDPFRSKIDFVITDLNLYEKYAINNYKTKIEDEDYYMYYFHTKGISKPDITQFQHQRQMLNFYTITKHEFCLELLKYYDVVGAVLYKFPKRHFAGNFWWTTSENTKKLNQVGDGYLAPEMYVCGSNSSKCMGLTNKYTAFCAQDVNIEEETALSDAEIIANASDKEYENEWGISALHLC